MRQIGRIGGCNSAENELGRVPVSSNFFQVFFHIRKTSEIAVIVLHHTITPKRPRLEVKGRRISADLRTLPIDMLADGDECVDQRSPI
jgi:hypothetical protein